VTDEDHRRPHDPRVPHPVGEVASVVVQRPLLLRERRLQGQVAGMHARDVVTRLVRTHDLDAMSDSDIRAVSTRVAPAGHLVSNSRGTSEPA
jgi:hypothetical protein